MPQVVMALSVGRILARTALAGIVCAALAACSDVGDSSAPGSATGGGADATARQPYDAAGDSNDSRADAGTDGTVFTPSDASMAGDAPGDTGMTSLGDTGMQTGNDTGSNQGADTGIVGSSDTGPPDTGGLDTGAPDTSTPDAGMPDTGLPDTGIVVDTGAPDTGAQDTGADATLDGDAGEASADAGANDTGGTDADAARPDGASDGGTADTGVKVDAGDSGSVDPCDPINSNSTASACLGSVSAACLTCAQTNGCLDVATSGANCEFSALGTTNANLYPSPLPDGKTCAQVVAPASVPVSERSICFEVMKTVLFKSMCGASTQLTPCLCGATDASKCLAGTAPPTGDVFDLYACDYNSISGSTINAAMSSNFQMTMFGAGAANALLACVGAFGCHCLGD